MIGLLMNWRIWAAIALAVALSASHWRAYTSGKKAVKAEWDKVELSRMAEAIRLSEANREKENTLKLSQERIQHALIKEKQARAVADAAAADSLVRLSAALAAGGGPGENTAPSCGTDDPRSAIIGECAGVVVGLDKENRRLAGKASALQDYASEVCVK